MTEWVGRLGVLLGVGLFFAGVVPGCDPKTTTGGDNSETHFLATCESECGGGLECICGVCTKRCSEADSCGGLSDDASCADSCGDVATKICDVTCSGDGDCRSLGAGFACNDGRCRTDGADGPGRGGASGTGGTPAGSGGEPVSGAGAGPLPSGNCQAAPDATPELLPNPQLDADVLARAAVVIGSCMPDDGIARNLSSMWSANRAGRHTYYLNVVQARCLADSRCGCEGVENCLGWKVETGVAPGCQTSCNGTVFRGCGEGVDVSEGYAVSIDCGRYGMDCSVESFCVDGPVMPCEGSDPDICRDGAPPLLCEGGTLREGADCEALGLGCAAGKCQGAGQDCVNQGFGNEDGLVEYEGISCQGGMLEACVTGKTATVSCAEQGPGFDCQSVNGLAFCGLASECLPVGVDGSQVEYFPTTCDGTAITFCNAGRIETLDCVDLGFTGCDATQNDPGCTPSVTQL